MMNKEEYKKELVRMWDSLRDEHKGEYSCYGVDCEFCPLGRRCDRIFSFEMIEAVEKWAKENPPKKFKVSRMEYDVIKLYFLNYYSIKNNYTTFSDFPFLKRLIDLGHFENADYATDIEDYLNNCEVIDK